MPGQYPEATGMFYGGQGIWAGTPDRSNTLRAAGFIHLDTGFIRGEGHDNGPVDLRFRRVRLTIDGRLLGQLEYRIMWDTVVDPVVPYDWHIDWRPSAEFNLRLGGFKSPVALERRARSYALWFIERTFVSQLAPNRIMGLFAYGQTRDGFFSYDVAITNGAQNNGVVYQVRSGNTPDFEGRVYFQPFRLLDDPPPELEHFGIGLSWSIGEEIGSPGDDRLNGHRSPGGLNVLSFLAADGVAAQGLRDRQGVHAYWRYGPWNAVFELMRSGSEVARFGEEGELLGEAYLANVAWMALFGYTFGADDENTFFGVNPTRPFDPTKGQWGGATIHLRYSELYIDPETFPLFAQQARPALTARSAGVSFQWHINLLLEAQLDFEVGALDGFVPSEVVVRTRVEARY